MAGQSGVFVLNDDKSLIAMQPAEFANEDDFQSLLSRFPELLVGDQIDPQILVDGYWSNVSKRYRQVRWGHPIGRSITCFWIKTAFQLWLRSNVKAIHGSAGKS